MKNVLLLYPNQLFAARYLPKNVERVMLIEEPLLFGTDKQYPMRMHKQKLMFMRSCMQRYAEEVLVPTGYVVDYVEFHQLQSTADIISELQQSREIMYFDFDDDVMRRRLISALNGLKHEPKITVIASPNFFLSGREVDEFFTNKQKELFASFYQWQRERFNILLEQDTHKPIGGKFSFDAENRKRLPKGHELPSFQLYGTGKHIDEALQYVEHHFPENPGSTKDFPWPTNHAEASEWLDNFLNKRLDNFGPYEDAIDGKSPWVYHSAISPLLNIGFLTPHEIVNRALARHQQNPVPLSSLEGFVRQVLGWREYVRGMYRKEHVRMRTANIFGHKRRLTDDWYKGTTGIPPVDDVIEKILTRGYVHHIERLMVIGNIMLLCDFHPDEVYRWFMEMHIDAYDWVMVPNVYGMSQYSDGGRMVTKPYVSGSNYILKMSHYQKGEWCDIWDGLYWRFIEKNQDRFRDNPRMSMMVSQLGRMQEDRRKIIGNRAEDFLRKKTVL
jgi:deoxyribodipyrimidine photolyase-related protein